MMNLLCSFESAAVDLNFRLDMTKFSFTVQCQLSNVYMHILQRTKCPTDKHIKCNDTGKCIHESKVCDQEKQCNDGSDEDESMCGDGIWTFIKKTGSNIFGLNISHPKTP